ncbi:VWA domain-containing protein [Clostridium sp. DSM 100503]|uniref:VWA domain-containing protein n=1 Tax=Clostridium sp. DSM 100503 TaxID=2963282 RepID=UPI002149FEBE|nr:VWA domain-containing protein [Clostridium sp. DSM 100503]MCR1950559.1 VWA domain-containing protein [Clostridium sp. DSM 100503]
MVSKRKFKIISIITSLFVISTLISLKSLNANANIVNSKPNFTITNLNASPNPAKVGEDILVSGKIVPGNFETSAQQKEIILVLDTSGSMRDEIKNTCTNDRLRYCTRHDSSDPNHHKFILSHIWVDDYCLEHETNGKHNTTRINELKKAAKSFIEKMKDVPNLKIGIVEYASNATKVSDLKNANDISLIESINGLRANGGTNIREGLRKGTYLLSRENNNANKTIVLMTDGNPTYYSKYDQLDDTDPTPYGTGNSTTSDTMTYTKNLAKDQIGARKYNAYSIGYGLDSNGTKYLKQIHTSMKNLPDDTDIKEKDGFFSKSDGSITEIFNQIAENIKNSYELKDVSLDINLNQSFALNLGGNEVKVGNIVYNKISENKSTGKIIYHADPINFSFIVKGSQVGQSQSILDNIDIKFLFENENLTVESKADVKVDIVSNELPNISAKLVSENIQEIKKDDEITIKYEINPEDFVYNNSSNKGEKDVVFLIDISKNKKDNGEYLNMIDTHVTDSIFNNTINNSDLIKTNTKYSIITFNSDAKRLFDFNYLPDKDTGSYENSINEKYIKKIDESGDKRDIGKALALVNETFNSARANTTKSIVIISNKDVNYTSNDYKNIINKGYRIITLSFNNEEKKSNLYNLHKALGGSDEDIIYAKNDFNNIRNSNFKTITEKLMSSVKYVSYEFKPVINLNLGSNFEPVAGIVRSTESGKQNIGIVEIPTIVYNLTQNNNYHAEGKAIEIKLKAKNLKPGTYNFGTTSDNKMIYKSIINNTVSTNIETPIITVKEEVKNLIHGLYNGVIDKEVGIQENDNKAFEIAQDSTVTFGAQFTLSGNNVDFNLNIDNKFKTVSTNDIKIYKVLKDSSGNSILTEITNGNRAIESQGDNNFKISINNIKESNQTSESDILVIYQARVKDELSMSQSLTNEIKFSNLSKSVNIITPQASDKSPSLPDLF